MQLNDSLDINNLTIVHYELVMKYLEGGHVNHSQLCE
jgi:hypothetical protein